MQEGEGSFAGRYKRWVRVIACVNGTLKMTNVLTDKVLCLRVLPLSGANNNYNYLELVAISPMKAGTPTTVGRGQKFV